MFHPPIVRPSRPPSTRHPTRPGSELPRAVCRGRCYLGAVRDPYDVLGVDRSASEADIRSAFRRLAAQAHPDRNPGDAAADQRFREVNAAHQILSDPQKRAAWDRFGENAFRPGGAGVGFDVADLGSIDGLFGDLLGALGIRTGDRGDVKKRVKLEFEEAASGCTRTVEYEVRDLCGRCRGDGAEPGTGTDVCGACNGRGKVRFQQGMLPVAIERPCSRCRGQGRTARQPCRECTGAGLATRMHTVTVDLPPGVETGSSKVLAGQGSRAAPHKPAGDLEVVVEVAPHPFFRRSGDDVLCSVPVTFAQAALGGEVDVPTLAGKAKVRVPPSTQPGSVLRLRGKGLPHRVRGGRGDQLVEITLEVPTELTPRARELIEALGRELGEDVQPQQKSFVEKLRGIFG